MHLKLKHIILTFIVVVLSITTKANCSTLHLHIKSTLTQNSSLYQEKEAKSDSDLSFLFELEDETEFKTKAKKKNDFTLIDIIKVKLTQVTSVFFNKSIYFFNPLKKINLQTLALLSVFKI